MRRRPVADWTMDELKEILKRVRQALGERDYAVMHSVVQTLDYLTHLAKDKQAAEIYRILVSSKSEKTRDVLRVLDLEREAEEAAAVDGTSQDGASAPAAEPDAAATKENVPDSAPTATPRSNDGRQASWQEQTQGTRPQWSQRLHGAPAGFRCIWNR